MEHKLAASLAVGTMKMVASSFRILWALSLVCKTLHKSMTSKVTTGDSETSWRNRELHKLALANVYSYMKAVDIDGTKIFAAMTNCQNELEGTQVFMSGSAVLRAATNGTWEHNDFDIYMVLPDPVTTPYVEEIKDMAAMKFKPIMSLLESQNFECQCYQKDWYHHINGRCVLTYGKWRHASDCKVAFLDTLTQCECPFDKVFDLIMTDGSVLDQFDLSICQNTMTEKTTVLGDQTGIATGIAALTIHSRYVANRAFTSYPSAFKHHVTIMEIITCPDAETFLAYTGKLVEDLQDTIYDERTLEQWNRVNCPDYVEMNILSNLNLLEWTLTRMLKYATRGYGFAWRRRYECKSGLHDCCLVLPAMRTRERLKTKQGSESCLNCAVFCSCRRRCDA
jgi:hypothetical protein